MKSAFKKMTTLLSMLLAGALLTAPAVAQSGAAQADNFRDEDDQLAQMTELEQVHATFHAAISVHDPVNGDSPAVITQRIRDILAIFTQDGEVTIVGTSAAAGNYIGNGDPDDPASCPLPSGDTSATGQQGTLCTFFKYVAGGLRPANKFVSLSPAYKTKYVPIKDAGEWTSSVYFECHYFDVSLNPATGQPFWTAKSHVSLDGEAQKDRRSVVIDARELICRSSSGSVNFSASEGGTACGRTPDARARQERSVCIGFWHNLSVFDAAWKIYRRKLGDKGPRDRRDVHGLRFGVA